MTLRHLLSLALICALSIPAWSQATMTLPVGFDTVDGTGATSFPFNSTPDHIWQWHYANTNFVGFSGPITITDIRIRASTSATVIAPFDFPSVEISAGSAITRHTTVSHSTTFAANLCTDLTLIRTGPWVDPVGIPASAGTTATFFSFGLTNPFVFDPTLGRDLILQVTKCGTNSTFAASIDGSSGGAGVNGGNRYGSTSSCTATVSTFSNNEFVPIVEIVYTIGGTPLPCTTPYQINPEAATFTTNGAPDPGGLMPIQTTLALGTPATVDLSSTLVGLPYDIIVHFSPSVILGSGGFSTAGGQTVNVNLADPLLTFIDNFAFVNAIANVSLPVSSTNPLTVNGQLLVLNPTVLDGFSISHTNEIIWQ